LALYIAASASRTRFSIRSCCPAPPTIPIEIVTDSVRIAIDAEASALDECAQLLAQGGAFLDVRLGQDEHEFLAAVATDEVARAQVLGDRLGDAAKDDVTGGVTV